MLEATTRFVFVQGQSWSTSLANERLQTPLNLNLSGLAGILAEATFIQQIILERNGNTSGNWVIFDTVSLGGWADHTNKKEFFK